jgi:NAD(P)-dependent dehydrogenase (short-subunit alcohol dehydrogenase family)
MTVRFDDRVAIVTGAGQGLGRSHAEGLARRGAKVVVNDLGPDGQPSPSALDTVAMIIENGGEAFAHGANVADYGQVEAMVDETLAKWGRVDILVNNAGILRDQSFVKMDDGKFSQVIDVHLKGAFNCSRAVWPYMRGQAYGRIVMTTSSSGLYGNFGQANYAAAKLGQIGLMNTMVIEGEKYGIRVNCISPIAKTAMTEGMMESRALDLFHPEDVTTGVLALCADDGPNRIILSAGAGCFSATRLQETQGIFLDYDQRNPETVLNRLPEILSSDGLADIATGPMHTLKFVGLAANAMGIDLSDASWGPKA